MTRVAFLGNFGVSHSTESHVALSLESLGCDVLRLQEGATRAPEVAPAARDFGAELFLWVQTYGLAESGGTFAERHAMLEELRGLSIPSVGFHLDRWWGLARQDQIKNGEAFFHCDWVFTADGGHDDLWSEAGLNHRWSPPAVYHAEAYDGTPRAEFACDVAFVGSWRRYGHDEWWPQRRAMLDACRSHYGPRFRCFPEGPAVRGATLNDLYASCKVAVGDSCLAPAVDRTPIKSYFSDRVAETTGRGALLVHPYVEGILNVHPHLPTFPLGDWGQMIEKLDYLLHNPEDRELLRKQNAEHTREHNTYRLRMQTLLETVGLA